MPTSKTTTSVKNSNFKGDTIIGNNNIINKNNLPTSKYSEKSNAYVNIKSTGSSSKNKENKAVIGAIIGILTILSLMTGIFGDVRDLFGNGVSDTQNLNILEQSLSPTGGVAVETGDNSPVIINNNVQNAPKQIEIEDLPTPISSNNNSTNEINLQKQAASSYQRKYYEKITLNESLNVELFDRKVTMVFDGFYKALNADYPEIYINLDIIRPGKDIDRRLTLDQKERDDDVFEVDDIEYEIKLKEIQLDTEPHWIGIELRST